MNLTTPLIHLPLTAINAQALPRDRTTLDQTAFDAMVNSLAIVLEPMADNRLSVAWL